MTSCLMNLLFVLFTLQLFSAVAKVKLTKDALTKVEASIYNDAACEEKWPELELMLPIGLKNDQDHHGITHASWDRRYEWREIFLESFMLFWPIQESKTRLMLMFDEEQREHPFQREIDDALNNVSDVLGYSFVRKVYNDANGIYYANKGHNRQQYIMFYADNYSTAEHIGFVDTDAMFITYIDRSDIFVNGSKIVVSGKIGAPSTENTRWEEVMQVAYDVIGFKMPVKCMTYFPVVIKRAHIIAFRAYLEKKWNMPFYDIMRLYIAPHMFGQFDMFCTYIFYFHQEDYAWFLLDQSPDWDYSNAWAGQLNSDEFYTPEMFYPKPRVAIHTNYHHPPVIAGQPWYYQVLQIGLCSSRPVYSAALDKYCNSLFLPPGKQSTYNALMYLFPDLRFVQPRIELAAAVEKRQQYLDKCAIQRKRVGILPQRSLPWDSIRKILLAKDRLAFGTVLYFPSKGRDLYALANGTIYPFNSWTDFERTGFVSNPQITFDGDMIDTFVKGPAITDTLGAQIQSERRLFAPENIIPLNFPFIPN